MPLKHSSQLSEEYTEEYQNTAGSKKHCSNNFYTINRYTSNIPEEEHEQSSCDAEQKDLQEGEKSVIT